MTPGPCSPPGDGRGLAEFARAWAKALAGTSYVPLTRDERQDFLYRLAERLMAALSADPFTGTPGYDIGTDLVTADFAAPEVLGHSVAVIDARFLADAGLSGETPRQR